VTQKRSFEFRVLSCEYRRSSDSKLLADLAVLSDDYFTVPDEKVKKIRAVLTVVGGTVVHDAGVLQPA